MSTETLPSFVTPEQEIHWTLKTHEWVEFRGLTKKGTVYVICKTCHAAVYKSMAGWNWVKSKKNLALLEAALKDHLEKEKKQ